MQRKEEYIGTGQKKILKFGDTTADSSILQSFPPKTLGKGNGWQRSHNEIALGNATYYIPFLVIHNAPSCFLNLICFPH